MLANSTGIIGEAFPRGVAGEGAFMSAGEREDIPGDMGGFQGIIPTALRRDHGGAGGQGR